MTEQLSVADWPKKIANEYRKGPVLPYDLEQWIILAIRAVEKRKGAEVLAACINEFDQYLCSCSTNFVGKPKSDHEKSCPKYVVGVLRKLQPAASHLEELLREERDGTEARLLCANSECPKRHLRIEWSEEEKICLGCLRDALNHQLGFKEGKEKARAITK